MNCNQLTLNIFKSIASSNACKGFCDRHKSNTGKILELNETESVNSVFLFLTNCIIELAESIWATCSETTVGDSRIAAV